MLPRLPNGKPDHRALAAVAAGGGGAPAATAAPAPGPEPDDLRRLFAEVLGVTDITEDSSFASLGGDSLSYVEMSVRLERSLGQLPDQWHSTPIRELRRAQRRHTRTASLDTSVALRAISITLIVGTHAGLIGLAGGAHVLLAIAGFNVARLHLTSVPRGVRVRNATRGVLRIAVASMVFIGLAYLVTDFYSLANVFLLNYLIGSGDGRQWHFWFIETLVYLQLAVVAMMAVPVVDRWDRRFPFGFPALLVGLALVTRYELVPGITLVTPLIVFWLLALGWAAAKATSRWQRLGVTVAALATVPGFFDNPGRDAILIVGLAVLTWAVRVPSLGPVNRLVALVARSSLYIYLTHWLVYPRLYHGSPLLAVVASLGGRDRLRVVGRKGRCGADRGRAAVLAGDPGPVAALR
jgi:hypothetical protein